MTPDKRIERMAEEHAEPYKELELNCYEHVRDAYLAGAKDAWKFLPYPENKPKGGQVMFWGLSNTLRRIPSVLIGYSKDGWDGLGVTAFLPIPKEGDK